MLCPVNFLSLLSVCISLALSLSLSAALSVLFCCCVCQVAKAQAFCRGVLDELTLRGLLGPSGSRNGSSNAAGPAAGDTAAAGQQQQQEEEEVLLPEPCSQGSTLSSQTEVVAAAADCGGANGGDGHTSLCLCKDDCSQPGAAAADDAATASAAAAGSNGGSNAGSNESHGGEGGMTASGVNVGADNTNIAGGSAKGRRSAAVAGAGRVVLHYPANRPIITCAAIEQVRGGFHREHGSFRKHVCLLMWWVGGRGRETGVWIASLVGLLHDHCPVA